MKIQIKKWHNPSVIFECDAESMKLAVEFAISKKIDLSSADLSRANLSHVNLSRADLSDADLSRADLSDADLSDADLSHANLLDANLSRANLSNTNLTRADLSSADLSTIKIDFLRVITAMPSEIPFLYKALLDGRIEGSAYNGECACLKGTLANAKHCKVTDLRAIAGLEKDSSEPAERWFMGINRGDSPENNQVSAITKAWIEEYCEDNLISLPTRSIVWSG